VAPRRQSSAFWQSRDPEALTDAHYEAWTELLDESLPVDVAEDVPTAKSATGKTKSQPLPKTPHEAIADLSDTSNRTPVFTGKLPAAMMPNVLEKNRWVLGRPPYDFLEIKLRDTPENAPNAKSPSFLLGLRGVMSPAREQELVKFAGDNIELQKIFRELSQQSRASKPGRFLGAYVNTVSKVFPNVYVFSANEGLPSAARDTFVVACSLKPLNFADLKRSGGYWGTPQFAAMETRSNSEKVYSSQMTSILELARGMTLTDDYAPVDNLLIPVFADQ
jgi:hypothetical protein